MGIGHDNTSEDPWVYIALPSPINYGLKVDRDWKNKVGGVHCVFTTNALAKTAMAGVHDLLLLDA